MNEATAIRSSRRVQRVELFDGGIAVMLTDGTGIHITYDGAKISFIEDGAFNKNQGFREIDIREVA